MTDNQPATLAQSASLEIAPLIRRQREVMMAAGAVPAGAVGGVNRVSVPSAAIEHCVTVVCGFPFDPRSEM
jgi:hypothetical protein